MFGRLPTIITFDWSTMHSTVTKLLFIDTQAPTAPVLDEMTQRSVAMLRAASGPYQNRIFRGSHRCACGAKSGSYDLAVTWAGQTYIINHLAAHYVACHREDVTEGEQAIVLSFPDIVSIEMIREDELLVPAMAIEGPRFLRG